MKLYSLFAIAGAAAVATTSLGAITVLADGNSVARVDDSSSAGMTDWVVDGTDQMFQQWFWYRINTDADTEESSIHTLGNMQSAVFDTNPFEDARPDTLALMYSGRGISIQPTWSLVGGSNGSGVSDMGESIVITNDRRTAISITFFQYSDFDLNGTAANDNVRAVPPNFNTVVQFEAGVALSETVVSPRPDAYEVNLFPVTRNRLDDGFVDNLTNVGGPVGPGDVTWAFQWDLTIPAGGSVVINKDKGIVPAPGALALVGLGGLLAARRRR